MRKPSSITKDKWRQKAVSYLRQETVDKTKKANKENRLQTFLQAKALDHMLTVVLGEGLATFKLPSSSRQELLEKLLSGADVPVPPVLSLSTDLGGGMLTLANWVRYQTDLMFVHMPDLAHARNNAILQGIRDSGLWSFILIMRVTYKAFFGPFSSWSWLQKLQDASEELQNLLDVHDPLVQAFLPDVAEALDLTAANLHIDDEQVTIYEHIFSKNVIAEQGPSLQISRWGSIMDVADWWRSRWHSRLILLTAMGLQEGYLQRHPGSLGMAVRSSGADGGLPGGVAFKAPTGSSGSRDPVRSVRGAGLLDASLTQSTLDHMNQAWKGLQFVKMNSFADGPSLLKRSVLSWPFNDFMMNVASQTGFKKVTPYMHQLVRRVFDPCLGQQKIIEDFFHAGRSRETADHAKRVSPADLWLTGVRGNVIETLHHWKPLEYISMDVSDAEVKSCPPSLFQLGHHTPSIELGSLPGRSKKPTWHTFSAQGYASVLSEQLLMWEAYLKASVDPLRSGWLTCFVLFFSASDPPSKKVGFLAFSRIWR